MPFRGVIRLFASVRPPKDSDGVGNALRQAFPDPDVDEDALHALYPADREDAERMRSLLNALKGFENLEGSDDANQ